MNDSAVKRHATYQDLLGLPDTVIGEILNGELWTQPHPSVLHASVASGLILEVGTPFQSGKGGPGGWWILPEPELHLKSDVLVPDLAGWKKERLPQIPETAFVELAPDWVCEVISPSTGRKDRMIKLPLYAHHKIPWVWLVEPTQGVIEVFHLDGQHWILNGTFGGNERFRVPPFEEVEMDLSLVWPAVGPSGASNT